MKKDISASLYQKYLILWSKILLNVLHIACVQSHIWEHIRERQRANSKARRSGRKESGKEALRKWAYPDVCNSATPERSEIPLVEKRQRRPNCQSILFDEEWLFPIELASNRGFNSQHGARSSVGCMCFYCFSKVPVCFWFKFWVKEGAGNISSIR